MKILHWDKITPVKTSKDHIDSYGFDGGPKGGYVPNMSGADADRWKAKLTKHTTPYPQIEIRKSINGVQLLAIVSLGNGYTYKYWKPAPVNYQDGQPTKGINVHLSLNGPSRMTFFDMECLSAAVQEAKEVLENLPKKDHEA